MTGNNLKYLIFLGIFGVIGGYFTALYSIEIMDSTLLEEAISQVGSVEMLILITTLQSLAYAVILGFLGRLIAKKIGLWREFTVTAKPLMYTAIASVVGGALFILADVLVFASFIPPVLDSYASKPTLNYIVASVTYGGVVEEILLRLFFMSLIAFVISKFSRSQEATETHLVIANILSALLFAACHLPTTVQSIGISPIIIIRCFVMNGAFGILFGRIYRKYGIGYAMLTHAGVHIVSKIIWILFI